MAKIKKQTRDDELRDALIALTKGDDPAAVTAIMPYIRAGARRAVTRRRLPFHYSEDLEQEGLANVIIALRRKGGGYDPTRPAGPWLAVVIRNGAVTAAKGFQRHTRHRVLSLDADRTDDGRSMSELVTDTRAVDHLDTDTTTGIDVEETVHRLKSFQLSRLERRVLRRYLLEYTYVEIAESLDVEVKSVDNALVRIRKKWERYREVGEAERRLGKQEFEVRRGN